MAFKIFLLFLTIVGFTVADSLIELSDEDFEAQIPNYDALLVMFYDPGCTFCESSVKEFDKTIKLIKGTKQPFALAKVNCVGSGFITCRRYNAEVSTFPDYKVFRRGKMGQTYGGPEDADGIVKFMRSRYGVASTELSTLAEIEKFLNSNEQTIIGFFEKDTNTSTKALYFKYANEFKDKIRFGHSSAAEVLSKYNEKDSIVFFRPPQFQNKFEPNTVTYKGDSEDELSSMIKKHWHGLVGHRTKENLRDFAHPNVIFYYEVDYVANAKRTNYWRNRILQVAKDHEDYKFAISSNQEFKLETEVFGHSYLIEKPLVIARDNAERKFKMTAEFSVENLKQFMSDLKEGKLEPFLKSQAIPVTNDGPVKIAVAKNFDEIVINNGKDTFIEFYAPWCSYCTDLAPVYDELGAKMVDEDIEIVKFDGTNNEVPTKFSLQGYPTLFWLPKDSKGRPVQYEGAKTVDSFITFIAKRASSELKNYDRNGVLKKSEL